MEFYRDSIRFCEGTQHTEVNFRVEKVGTVPSFVIPFQCVMGSDIILPGRHRVITVDFVITTDPEVLAKYVDSIREDNVISG